jgi:acetyltransferase-like isoleucine patch superfamily enzyme
MKAAIRSVLKSMVSRFEAAIKPSRVLAERYPEYQIGSETYGDLRVHTWNQGTTLKIGSFTSVALGVQVFLGGEHRADWVTTFPFSVLWPQANSIHGHPGTKGDVVIGNDVWLCTESVILSGVTIGDGAVVGARAVVAKNVPPYAIVAGNPAKIINYRFSDDQIHRLISIRWWEWPNDKILRAMPDLLSEDISTFLDKAERGHFDDVR